MRSPAVRNPTSEFTTSSRSAALARLSQEGNSSALERRRYPVQHWCKAEAGRRGKCPKYISSPSREGTEAEAAGCGSVLRENVRRAADRLESVRLHRQSPVREPTKSPLHQRGS